MMAAITPARYSGLLHLIRLLKSAARYYRLLQHLAFDTTTVKEKVKCRGKQTTSNLPRLKTGDHCFVSGTASPGLQCQCNHRNHYCVLVRPLLSLFFLHVNHPLLRNVTQHKTKHNTEMDRKYVSGGELDSYYSNMCIVYLLPGGRLSSSGQSGWYWPSFLGDTFWSVLNVIFLL